MHASNCIFIMFLGMIFWGGVWHFINSHFSDNSTMGKEQREQWINSRIALMMEDGVTDEEAARAYLNDICDKAESDGITPDEKLFLCWVNLTLHTPYGGQYRNFERLYKERKIS